MKVRFVVLCLSLLALQACQPQENQKTASKVTTDAVPHDAVQHETDVLIVGGGLSGLSTAYHLKQAGIRSVILEMAPRVGGRVRTGQYPDQSSAEVGLAEFWEGNPALEIARDLKVKMERVDTSFSSYLAKGKLHPFTQDSNAAFLKAALGSDYPAYQAWDAQLAEQIHALEKGEIKPEWLKLKDIAFADWLKQQKQLPEKGRELIHAVLEPEIGTGLSRIGTLDGLAEWHLFTGKGLSPNHVVGGNQGLTEALAQHIGAAHISLNTQVTNVEDGPEGVVVRAIDTANYRNKTFKAKYVVLAIPLYRLFEVQFQPRLSDKIYEAVHSQSWGAYFTAHVHFDKSAESYWTQAGKNILPILTGGPLGVMYDSLSNGPDEVMLNLLITGDFAEMYNARTMSLDDVQKQLSAEFAKTFPGIEKHIRRWSFYRYHPRAIASWPVGRSRFDALSEGLRQPHGHLYFGGDFTESSHSDGAVKAAVRVSRQITQAMKNN